MVPTDLPDGVVGVNKIDTHVDGAVTGSETGGCNGGARRGLVEDGLDFRVPAFVWIISFLDKAEVVFLEPNPVCRMISVCPESWYGSMAASGRYYHLPDAWAILVSIVEGGSCDTCAREGMSKVGALLPAIA